MSMLPTVPSHSEGMSYYEGKLASLREIFGTEDVVLAGDTLRVGARVFPIVDDVIIALAREHWPQSLHMRVPADAIPDANTEPGADGSACLATDIQYSFGEEWKLFASMLPEHEATFHEYFDLVDLAGLHDQRLCDLGCGMGRWSFFASRHCREIVLVDFSEAVFVARHTLRDRPNAIFVMADIRELPFGPDFAQLIFSLGVLHHLPTPAIEEVRRLSAYAPRLLVYLYYALDNRPSYFRHLLVAVTALRLRLARVQHPRSRDALATLLAAVAYKPLIYLGRLVRPLGLSRFVPLYEAYHDQGWEAIRQDAYDRFFTRIEQRISHEEILALRSEFSRVTISSRIPYWHFLCER